MNKFYTIWAGQVLSTLGSNLTGFAVGLWLYQQTGSATLFSLYLFVLILPSVLLSPFLGVLVDRLDRKKTMLLADIGSGVMTATLALVMYFDVLQIWHLFVLSALSSAFSAMQRPAYSAAISLLVPKDKLGKAAGLVQLSLGTAQVAAPLLGGILILSIGLEGIIALDFASFLFAMVTLALVKFPPTPKSTEGIEAKGRFLQEVGFGFHYLKRRPGLLRLLFFMAGINFAVGIVYALATPAVMLSFDNDTVVLGSLLSMAGVGMLSGSVLISLWGGPRYKVSGILIFSLLTGVGILLVGLEPRSPVLLSGFIFLVLFGSPVVAGCSQAIWLRKVSFDVQGKVFGVRQMVASSSAPIAYLLAGPLADKVFEPLMTQPQGVADVLSTLTGAGPGAGMRLMFIFAGCGLCLMVLWAWRNRHIRCVEADLPDADQLVVDLSPVKAN